MTTAPRPAPSPVLVEDPRFGQISLLLDSAAGELSVHGEQIPPATLRRLPTAKKNKHVPIGTRSGEGLALCVDNRSVRILPARGRLLRRSFRVDVTCQGVSYRLVPDSVAGSRLLRDNRRVGSFTSAGNGAAGAEWATDRKATAQDAAVGYTLATAFGTGADPWWMLTIDFVGGLIP